MLSYLIVFLGFFSVLLLLPVALWHRRDRCAVSILTLISVIIANCGEADDDIQLLSLLLNLRCLPSLIYVQPVLVLAPHPSPPCLDHLHLLFQNHPIAHPWNRLPVSFRQPCTNHSADDVTLCNSSSNRSPLSSSITHSLFRSVAQNSPFSQIFSTVVWYHPRGLPSRTMDRTYSARRFFVFRYFSFFLLWVVW